MAGRRSAAPTRIGCGAGLLHLPGKRGHLAGERIGLRLGEGESGLELAGIGAETADIRHAHHGVLLRVTVDVAGR